jgi:hypothetical protein
MSWPSSIGVALLTAALSAVAAGFVAAGCVDWYNISSREGKSGYFIIFIGLVGAVAGLIGGLVISRFFGGFFAGLGVSAASMMGLAGIVAGCCWALADIAPTLHGHSLMLEVEFRLPPGAPKPGGPESKPQLIFERGDHRTSGELNVDKAYLEDGRWVVPGSVFMNSMRNPRSIAMSLEGKSAVGFQLEFPSRPGEKYQQWSRWQPDWPQFPANETMYRFRIQEIIPPPEVPYVDPFPTMTKDTPLEQWLPYYDPWERNKEQSAAALAMIRSRPADLAELVRSPAPEKYDMAMQSLQKQLPLDPLLMAAMKDVLAQMESQVETVPREDVAEGELFNRFNRWGYTWYVINAGLTGKARAEAREPGETMLRLVKARESSPIMQRVASEAQDLLLRLAGDGPPQ